MFMKCADYVYVQNTYYTVENCTEHIVNCTVLENDELPTHAGTMQHSSYPSG